MGAVGYLGGDPNKLNATGYLQGDLPAANSSGALVPVHIGTAGNVLTVNAAQSALLDYEPGGGGGGSVSSVFGRSGAVVAAINDYTVAQISGLVAQLAAKAPTASPTFTGTVTLGGAPASGTEATTKTYVDTADLALATSITQRIAVSFMDAKGDLISASADNVLARVGVGADGTVLTADSAQTAGIKWAAASGSGTSVKVRKTGNTAGTIAVAASPTLTDLGMDVVIPAASGDWIGLTIEALANNTGANLSFDVATRNAANNADVNYVSSGGASSLAAANSSRPPWYIDGGVATFTGPRGEVIYQVVAGDINAGNVRFRVYGAAESNPRSVFRSAAFPASLTAKNYGQGT